MKEITDKLDFIEIKIFCSKKDNVTRMGSEVINWEKIFSEHLSDKRLLSKVYKELLKFNNMKMNNPMKKMAKRSEQIPHLKRQHR